jgi:alcohol dehydrogenase, propanol-preferring
MKAVLIKQQNGEVAVEERERPSPGPGQVLIRVHAYGVCYSDLAVLQGAFPFVEFPLVPGHEVVA